MSGVIVIVAYRPKPGKENVGVGVEVAVGVAVAFEAPETCQRFFLRALLIADHLGGEAAAEKQFRSGAGRPPGSWTQPALNARVWQHRPPATWIIRLL
jgi:hypothetical protein